MALWSDLDPEGAENETPDLSALDWLRVAAGALLLGVLFYVALVGWPLVPALGR